MKFNKELCSSTSPDNAISFLDLESFHGTSVSSLLKLMFRRSQQKDSKEKWSIRWRIPCVRHNKKRKENGGHKQGIDELHFPCLFLDRSIVSVCPLQELFLSFRRTNSKLTMSRTVIKEKKKGKMCAHEDGTNRYLPQGI